MFSHRISLNQRKKMNLHHIILSSPTWETLYIEQWLLLVFKFEDVEPGLVTLYLIFDKV